MDLINMEKSLVKWKQGASLAAAIKRHFNRLLSLQASSFDLTGLDISPDSLKLLKFNRKEDKPKVENFGVLPIAPDIFVKDEIKNHQALSEALKELFQNAGVITKQVALAIPRSKVVTKTITLDKRLTQEEIESRAWIEANRHFPDLIGDIYLDFYSNDVPSSDNSQLEVTLVACRKELIKGYLDALHLAGLEAKIIDVDSYALERALLFLLPSNSVTIGLLNLNSNLSSLIVLSDNRLIYAHDQNFEGQRFKAQINEYHKNLTVDKLDESLLKEDANYQNILHNNLLAHLRHIMQFFYTSRPNFRLQKLLLSGEFAALPAVPDFIQKEIGLETQVIDLASNLNFADNINITLFKTHAPNLALACGLALTEGRST